MFIIISIIIIINHARHCTAIGKLHGITQCYLSPNSGDFPVLTAAEVGT